MKNTSLPGCEKDARPDPACEMINAMILSKYFVYCGLWIAGKAEACEESMGPRGYRRDF